ncbi:unnamed protein product [Parajaminaea phylloscopi]
MPIKDVQKHLNREHGYYPRPEAGVPEDAEWGLDPRELPGFLLWASAGERADRIDEAVLYAKIEHRQDKAAWKAFNEWKPPTEKKLELGAGPVDSVPSALVVARQAAQELAVKALPDGPTHQAIREVLADVDAAIKTASFRHDGEWDIDTSL